ncbi:MAG: NADH-quinone oxidoreductase subunit NuoH [Actinomycetaceae bacterium]|nr:NADH-quinone oxidoreductase subunit NuoH [Actinomycetaceae bacterium]
MVNFLAEVSQQVPANFQEDNIWIWLIKAVLILVYLLTSVIFVLVFERKVLGRMQNRRGPNRVGPAGIFQSFADAPKLLLKEHIWPNDVDKLIFFFAPTVSAAASFIVMAVIPVGPQVSVFGIHTPLQLADSPVSMLFIVAVAALGEYGLVFGGWSSHAPLPLIGSVRSATQMISYELGLSIALVTVFLYNGTMSTSGLVAAQTDMWNVLPMFPAFIVYLISMFGETNRLPFDLPEAEGEIVAGAHTEYSSMKFGWYYLSEYLNMFNVSMIGTTVFFGGWRAGPIVTWLFDLMGVDANANWWPVLWFTLKIWCFIFFIVWVRATLVRMRYDTFMKLGWKVLIPVALAWLTLVMIGKGLDAFVDFTKISWINSILLFVQNNRPVMMIVFVVLILAVLLLMMAPEKKNEAIEIEDARFVSQDEEFDAFAGGFPVPPLNGQKLPPSPRAQRVEVAQAAPAQVTQKEESNDGE